MLPPELRGQLRMLCRFGYPACAGRGHPKPPFRLPCPPRSGGRRRAGCRPRLPPLLVARSPGASVSCAAVLARLGRPALLSPRDITRERGRTAPPRPQNRRAGPPAGPGPGAERTGRRAERAHRSATRTGRAGEARGGGATHSASSDTRPDLPRRPLKRLLDSGTGPAWGPEPTRYRKVQRRALDNLAVGLLVVLSITLLTAGEMTPAGAAAVNPPTVTGFKITTTALAGGYVSFTANVVGGSSCTLSSRPPLSGLPSTTPCSALGAWPTVYVPANTSNKPKNYTFTLVATPLPGFGNRSTKTSIPLSVGPAAPTTYVALGDSYSSGEANPPFTNSTGCDVSQNMSWPLMTAASLKVSSPNFHNVACSGAEISDLTQPWAAMGQLAQTTQLASDSPSLATVTIGGNSMIEGATANGDWGFADILKDCYVKGILSPANTQANRTGCSADGTIAKALAAVTSTNAVTGLQARLTAAYEAIKSASQSTKLLVVGYPDIFPPSWSAKTAFHCAWLGPDDINGLDQLAADLNATVQAAAKAARVSFVSTLNAIAGHTLCTAKSDIESITIDSGALASSAGHPLPPGQKAMAKVVEPALKALEKSGAPSGKLGLQKFASGGSSYCKVLSTGGMDCWGDNTGGELGDGTTDGPDSCPGTFCADTPQPVSGITDAASIASDNQGYCALLTTGEVECWGNNSDGQVGNGTIGGPDSGFNYSGYDTPQAVAGITNATSIASDGNEGYCAVLTTSGVECWGYNYDGEVGNGTTGGSAGNDYDTPQAVVGISDVASITGGGKGYCALLSTGGVECWGDNGSGELGNGSFDGPDGQDGEDYATPQVVTEITDAVSVSSNHDGYCAVLASGGVDCWGFNGAGNLGNGAIGAPEGYDVAIPQAVIGINDAKSVVSEGQNMGYCSLVTSGSVLCWGYNGAGEVGNGTVGGPDGASGYDSPQAVAGLTNATSIASDGTDGYCAVLTTSGMERWGDNASGELGNGIVNGPDGANGYDTPQTVTGLTDAGLAGDGANGSVCGELVTGGVACWGSNYEGQVGNGSIGGPDGEYGYDIPQVVVGLP